MTLFLSRVRLKQDASVAALLPLLRADASQAGNAGHHLIWSLFADGADRRRDFLWREMERQGHFLILSERVPADRHALFDIDEPRVFAPTLAEGDRLRFSLRANAIVRRRDAARGRSFKHDVVMDALRACPEGQRSDLRRSVMREKGFAWLGRQAAKAGFAVASEDVQIDGYRQHRVGRGRSKDAMSFSTLDFEGVLQVREPALFVTSVARGMGASKAYGCGLMLIRRA